MRMGDIKNSQGYHFPVWCRSQKWFLCSNHAERAEKQQKGGRPVYHTFVRLVKGSNRKFLGDVGIVRRGIE